ncbi:MAG: preprotein translocase subunit SecE [Actinomycetota bacterium]
MNREVKRMMKKRERAADRLVRPPASKRKRTKPMEFVKEVRGELGRVAWPTRNEVVTYTVVVLVSVAFFMLVIGGLDFVFTKAVVQLISGGG